MNAVNENILVPSSIFNRKLSVFESVVRYLRDNLGLGNKTIGLLLGKSDKSIWQAYNNSFKKFKGKLKVEISYFIPISKFKGKSLFGCVVKYLRDDCGLSYSEIARMLKRDDRTIWTVYNRKIGKKKIAVGSWQLAIGKKKMENKNEKKKERKLRK